MTGLCSYPPESIGYVGAEWVRRVYFPPERGVGGYNSPGKEAGRLTFLADGLAADRESQFTRDHGTGSERNSITDERGTKRRGDSVQRSITFGSINSDQLSE